MDTLLLDLRQAFRGMRNNPAFVATAVLALALGIGANTAIFSVVNEVILKPLAYPEPDRLVAVERSFKQGTGESVSVPKFNYWKDHNQVFDSITAYDFGGPGLNLSNGSTPEQVRGSHVSQQFFRVFGAAPFLGHTFTAADDVPNGPHVTVLSYALWSRRFNSDPNIIGKAIDLSGQPFTVIAVMPASFQDQSENDTGADLWLPLQADPASSVRAHYLSVVARLKQGVSVGAANAQLKLVADAFRRGNRESVGDDEGIIAIPLQERIVGDVRPALLVLVAAVCLVLLIACANMANLLLAKAATRQRELAVRAAIGASRARLIRQMLTESVLLSVIGGLFGLLLGVWGVRGLLQISPGEIPRVEQLIKASPFAFLDWRVFLFTLGVALITGILFGLVPALRLSNPDLNGTLKEASSRSGTGLHQNRARSVLVVSELAIAIVLLTGAGLLIRSFSSLRSVSTGIDPHNVLTFQTSLADARYNNSEVETRMEQQAVEKLERVPGVTSASVTWMLPLHSNIDLPMNVVGRTPPKGEQYDGDYYWRGISPHYFDVYRIPLLRGRLFSNNDTAASQPVLIINEVIAKKLWPKEDPIGKQVIIGKGLGPQFDDAPRQIVGVVAGQREDGVDQPFAGVMFLPSAQVPNGLLKFANALLPRYWVMRTTSDPANFANAVNRVFQSVDSRLPVAKIQTMDTLMSSYTARQNFNMLLLTVFAGIALLLAGLGIFGLISYTVQQRTQEIGIRMALGAGKLETLQLVGQQILLLLGIGLAVGIGASYAVTRYMASLLFEVKPVDPFTFAAVIATLTLVTIAATAIPARRAMKVDPVIALRYE
jgi:predicted permease